MDKSAIHFVSTLQLKTTSPCFEVILLRLLLNFLLQLLILDFEFLHLSDKNLHLIHNFNSINFWDVVLAHIITFSKQLRRLRFHSHFFVILPNFRIENFKFMAFLIDKFIESLFSHFFSKFSFWVLDKLIKIIRIILCCFSLLIFNLF